VRSDEGNEEMRMYKFLTDRELASWLHAKPDDAAAIAEAAARFVLMYEALRT